MTTHRPRTLSALVASWVTTTSLLAAPIGRPAPGPCTADGYCVPKRSSWGYTQTEWRLWPGTTLDDESADTPAIGSEYIPPAQAPDPRSEDKQAPPRIDALEPEAAPTRSTDDGFELPPRENFDNGARQPAPAQPAPAQPGPGQPAAPADPATPARPPFMEDGLPFGNPNGGALPTNPPANPPTTLPFGQPPAAEPDNLFPSGMKNPTTTAPPVASDAPPQFPFRTGPYQAPTNRTAVQSQVVPASATVHHAAGRGRASLIPAEATPRQAPQRAPASSLREAPPDLPKGLFGSR